MIQIDHTDRFEWLSRTSKPQATSRQKPILGAYRIRSATTNPTGKNRLEAGMNGSTINAKH